VIQKSMSLGLLSDWRAVCRVYQFDRPGFPPCREIGNFIAKHPASALHMLRIVPHTVPRVGRSDEHFADGF